MNGKVLLGVTLLSLALVSAEAGAGDGDAETVASRAEPSQPVYQDGFRALVDWEGRQAQAEGDQKRALRMFTRLVRLDRNDAFALREMGRSAAALGSFAEAEQALRRCNELRNGAPDPELHFIRGDALFALQRRSEGLKELEIAEKELQIAPQSRQKQLWLARIHTLRGHEKPAIAIYAELLAGDPGDREVVLAMAEAYILASRTKDAEKLLQAHVRAHHDPRAEDMLAWVLELRGDTEGELAQRKTLSRRWDGAQAPSLVQYARSLERAGRYEAALDVYREAEVRGNQSVKRDITRIEGRLAPELMFQGRLRNYPTGAVAGTSVGAVVLLAPHIRFSVIGSRDSLIGGEGDTASLTSGSAWVVGAPSNAHQVGLGATGWQGASGRARGSAAMLVQTALGKAVRLHGRGSYAAPWAESAATIRESGSTSGAELQLYSELFSPNLILVGVGRFRWLDITESELGSPHRAREALGAAGLDWVASADHASVLRGHSFDDELLLPVYFGDALVLSYRHYEVATDGGLSPHIILVRRARVEELSVTAREVMGSTGMFALGASGGLGYDRMREARMWRARGELLLSVTPMIRISLSSEFARESLIGLTGDRFAGSLGVHADL